MAITLRQLIEEGEALEKQLQDTGMVGRYIPGKDYIFWVEKSITYLEKNNSDYVERFKAASNNNGEKNYYSSLSILKSIEEMSNDNDNDEDTEEPGGFYSR